MLINKNQKDIFEFLKERYCCIVANFVNNSFDLKDVIECADLLKIPPSYLNKVTFDSGITSNGIYLPEEKTIIINPAILIGTYHLGFASKESIIIEYFTLIFHELCHVFQFIYKDNYINDKSLILKESDNLMFLSNSDPKLYNYFPSEINANLQSALFISKFSEYIGSNKLQDYCEKQLVYYLTSQLFHERKIINSQLKLLYKIILDANHFDNYPQLEEKDKLFYGVKKDKCMMDNLIKSYQTQKLCLDIKR